MRLYKGRDQTLKQARKEMVFENNRVQISALRVAKLSRRYFAKDRFPFSCLQISIARRIAPIETIATILLERKLHPIQPEAGGC
jgi:hypothetical protein